MVFPGKRSNGCYLCRRRKVKVCVLHNSSISNNTQVNLLSLLTMKNGAMGQNQNVCAASHVVRNAPDTQTVLYFGNTERTAMSPE